MVDFKLKLSLFNSEVMLGDQCSLDGCYLWGKTTPNKIDKDRLRQNLGSLIKGYEEVARRIGLKLG